MTIRISRVNRIGVLTIIAGISGSLAMAQTQGPAGVALPNAPAAAVADNYWPNHWWWYDNTYRPYYQFQYRQQPTTGYWQGYSGPPSINRSQGALPSPTGTFYQGGGYESGIFQRPMPYGWW
jgi:hypothetical protein